MKINTYHQKIMKQYENIRKKNEEEQRARRRETEERIPEIPATESLMAEKSILIARSGIRPNKAGLPSLQNLKEELTALKNKKYRLLEDAGLPEDYLELKYQCSLCSDTGYAGGKKCKCYYEKMAELVYEDSEFSELLKECSLGTLKSNIFSEKTDPRWKMSPKQNMEKNIEFARKYTEKFDSHSMNLYLSGESGTGKTCYASSIAGELIEKGHLVVYRTAWQLMKDVKEAMYGNNQDLTDLLLDSDLLIIDDLGTEMNSELSKTEMFNIINGRLLKRKKVIVSTNLGLNEIKDKYSERLSSRIMGDFFKLAFFGEDLRITKGNETMKEIKNLLK